MQMRVLQEVMRGESGYTPSGEQQKSWKFAAPDQRCAHRVPPPVDLPRRLHMMLYVPHYYMQHMQFLDQEAARNSGMNTVTRKQTACEHCAWVQGRWQVC